MLPVSADLSHDPELGWLVKPGVGYENPDPMPIDSLAVLLRCELSVFDSEYTMANQSVVSFRSALASNLSACQIYNPFGITQETNYDTRPFAVALKSSVLAAGSAQDIVDAFADRFSAIAITWIAGIAIDVPNKVLGESDVVARLPYAPIIVFFITSLFLFTIACYLFITAITAVLSKHDTIFAQMRLTNVGCAIADVLNDEQMPHHRREYDVRRFFKEGSETFPPSGKKRVYLDVDEQGRLWLRAK
jgi:hypothetical protein